MLTSVHMTQPFTINMKWIFVMYSSAYMVVECFQEIRVEFQPHSQVMWPGNEARLSSFTQLIGESLSKPHTGVLNGYWAFARSIHCHSDVAAHGNN